MALKKISSRILNIGVTEKKQRQILGRSKSETCSIYHHIHVLYHEPLTSVLAFLLTPPSPADPPTRARHCAKRQCATVERVEAHHRWPLRYPSLLVAMRAQHSALLRPEHKGMPDLSDGAIDKKLRQAAPQRRIGMLGMLSTRGMVGTCVAGVASHTCTKGRHGRRQRRSRACRPVRG